MTTMTIDVFALLAELEEKDRRAEAGQTNADILTVDEEEDHGVN